MKSEFLLIAVLAVVVRQRRRRGTAWVKLDQAVIVAAVISVVGVVVVSATRVNGRR